MLKRTKELEDLDRRWERHLYGELSLHQALGRFAALWQLARVLHPEPSLDWPSDLGADLAIARAVNGLPPA